MEVIIQNLTYVDETNKRYMKPINQTVKDLTENDSE